MSYYTRNNQLYRCRLGLIAFSGGKRLWVEFLNQTLAKSLNHVTLEMYAMKTIWY